MKKLLLLIGIMFLMSCEKPTYCWSCELYSQWNDQRIINTSEFCNKTEKEVLDNKELWNKIGHRYECRINIKLY